MPAMILSRRLPVSRLNFLGASHIGLISVLSVVLSGSALEIHAGNEQSSPHSLTQVQRSARTASPQIGAAMAVLATLQDADVLPPEGTREANHIIRFVIQFQSVFTKSDDPTVQAFARQALVSEPGDQADLIIRTLRTTGWTSAVLEGLAREEATRSSDDLQKLAQGFAPFNLSVEDFHRFMQLVRDARLAFQKRGLEFHHVFASRRKEMPGAESS